MRSKNRKSEIQSNIVASQQYSLTPSTIDKKIVIKNEEGETINIKDNPAYQSVLDIAEKLNDKEIKNIALTGAFGSGKSSVLLTLKKDFLQHKYLNISLATLDCLNKEDNTIERADLTRNQDQESARQGENKKVSSQSIKSNYEDDESLNRKIEYSILQQLIYKEKAKDIPQSRFKRIKHISECNSCIIASGILLFIVSCCILLEPKFLHIQSFYTIFSCGEKWRFFWDIILSAYILFFSAYIFKKLIIKTYNNRINKLNLKDGEIEINESTSIFNKHLDEIIYFFEVTDYNVVILEDLDRFYTPNIFLKLRELNYLLNNSNAISRESGKITFIYAIRDDIFKDTSRTKCFDYISTVIPVINPSNSRDKLLNALKEKGVDEISDEVCMDLGFFIDDMRILKNIVNEFIQYRQKLQLNLSSRKMLGMILYKNYHPSDFAKLHNQKGIVYEIISNRAKYHNSNVGEKEKRIEKLEEESKSITNFYSDQKAKELRTLYVMKYIETNNYIQSFYVNNIQYTLTQIIENPDLFFKLENNSIQQYHHIDFGRRDLNTKFKDIEKKVDSKYSYRERLNLYPKRAEEIKTEIEKLQQEILELRTLPLHQILKTYSADDFFAECNGNRLIAFLIRAGYIDEDYYDYISYFYPGVITPSDREFILDLKIGKKKDYDYKIHKIEAVINDIHESYFSKPEILNVSILDFIVENKNTFSLQYTLLKNNIKKHNAFDFIGIYYKEGRAIEQFFSDILSVWNDFFSKGVLEAKSTQIENINFELLLRFFPKSNIKKYENEKFIDYISNRLDFYR